MKVFISGASGLLGGNCLKYFKTQNLEVVGSHLTFPTAETVYFNTLQDGPDNFDLLGFQPDVIVHCGALSHVDYCESHEAESFEITV
jgi:dTDP-4-dehydrorhamnose reductase